VEKAVILHSIGQTETLYDTARQLGVDLSTLTRKKQKYGISKKSADLKDVGAK
jgi:DNA-binding NtrC family response regulator